MKRLLTIGLASVLAMTLAACGGGGDSSAAAPTVPTAEGFWEGTSSNGATVGLAILEDGQTWGYYARGGVIEGALKGVTSSSGTTLSGSGTDFDLQNRTVSSGTYNGTFSPRSVIRINTSSGASLTATYVVSYDQPASLAALAGTFSGSSVTGSTSPQAQQVNISAAGAITVSTTAGCSASGSAVPRQSGKNIFDVAVTFTGTSCALGNGTVTTGIGYYSATTGNLLVMGLNAAKTDGFIYAGFK